MQDWAVPVVYESAPLVLLRPEQRAAPLIRLTPADTKADGDSAAGPGGLPRPPDAGFFGRDETLLALDRAFDTQPVVLLHAFAGAGKSATAAEFARWYAATGGLDHPDHPEWGPGAVLWSSFEHHLTADRVLGTAGDHFAALLEASGIAWAAVTEPAAAPRHRGAGAGAAAGAVGLGQRRAGHRVPGRHPQRPGRPASRTSWPGCSATWPSRPGARCCSPPAATSTPGSATCRPGSSCPPMPMRESLQLAAALAARHGHSIAGADWRPLLRYAAGNPLTITVLVGQALRENLTTTADIEDFVARLRAGEAQLEAGEDAALGRTRSLAASLSYGFAQAFTAAERARLAVLHLFRDTADVDALRAMGDPEYRRGGRGARTGRARPRRRRSRCWTGPPTSAC